MKRTNRLFDRHRDGARGRSTLAACGSSCAPPPPADKARPPHHHALQRPARADDRRAGEGLRSRERHPREGPLRRRSRAGQPDRDGGLPLTGRRLLHREHTAARVPAGARPAGAAHGVDARDRRLQVQLDAGRLGGRVGPGQRDGLQHRQVAGVAAPEIGDGPRVTGVEGQARHRPRRDRLPADRHVDHEGEGQERRARRGSRPSSRTRAATRTPTTSRSPTWSTAARCRSA